MQQEVAPPGRDPIRGRCQEETQVTCLELLDRLDGVLFIPRGKIHSSPPTFPGGNIENQADEWRWTREKLNLSNISTQNNMK